MDTLTSHHRQPDDAPTDDAESHHDTESNASWDLESPNESDSDDEATKAQNLVLLQAASAGDEEILQSALDEGANLVARDADGQTSLHLAILHDHESMVRMLLKKGADIEATTQKGGKPLYNAAEMGNLRLVDLLLQFRADVESRNTIRKTTALYQAVSKENLEVARFLLDHGADVDAKDPNGYTPLFSAVSQGNLDLVEMLLQYGASKKTRLPDGRNVEDLASGDNEMRDRLLLVLQEDQVLRGPSIAGPNLASERPYAYIRPPPADRTDKLNACDGFKCTIVDFFLGDREQRIQVSPTIYEVLYGKGPSAIMDAARGTKMPGRGRAFRWYHFPANNVRPSILENTDQY
jgi:ankyrin repeat protein